MVAIITGVANKPATNGDFVVELSMPDGSTDTATISPDIAQVLVAILQPMVLERAIETGRTLSFPSVEVNGLSVAHQGVHAELVVATNQTGQLVFRMSDEWLHEARQVIDRILASRQSSKTIQ
jgi:hypothetical protein